MANAFATNFPMTTGTNHGVINIMWKLTRCMKAAGWTYKASSNGTTKDTSGISTNDLWGGSATPLTDVYPGFETTNAWWVGSGPTTLKQNITTAPTGSPIRGEIITQATSGATGELIGYVFDTTAGTGWMIISPQTGSFNNVNTITGNISGAVFTPNGSLFTYTREVMIGKTFTSTPSVDPFNGSIYYVCADAVNESASLFSTLATSAGCTTSVWPGGGGTGNGFPTIAITVRGGGGTTTGNDSFFGITFSNNGFETAGINAQIGAVNATPSAGVSADGSFYVATPKSAFQSSTTNVMTGFMFTRLDDTEPGDVDPYAWSIINGATSSSWSRTSATGAVTYNTLFYTNLYASSAYSFVAYQARGVIGKDIVSGYAGGIHTSALNNSYAIMSSSNASFPGGALRHLNYPTTTGLAPLIREPLLVHTNGTIPGTFRHFKGRTRWMSIVSSGNVYNTFDSKTWLICSSTYLNSISYLGAIAIGPYDGTTTPSESPLA